MSEIIHISTAVMIPCQKTNTQVLSNINRLSKNGLVLAVDSFFIANTCKVEPFISMVYYKHLSWYPMKNLEVDVQFCQKFYLNSRNGETLTLTVHD
jgi:c-di-GMP-related signal transduction protein